MKVIFASRQTEGPVREQCMLNREILEVNQVRLEIKHKRRSKNMNT